MILVTGATGFIGTRVVNLLRGEGRQVRCLVRDPSARDALDRLGCEVVRGDVTEPASLVAAVNTALR